MRWLSCAAVWTIAIAASLYTAATTRWGPVVVTLSPRHGVHLGDILAVLMGVVLASTVTAVALLTSPARPTMAVVLRWVLSAAVWMTALVASLYVAAATEWGPVVVRLSRYHGVHLGDIAAVLVGVAIASTVTAVALLTSPARRTPDAPGDGEGVSAAVGEKV
jgi:hypothetical protein